MPTDRFLRLPKEKIELIRVAATKEFVRVPPEEVSINRIIRDAEISRGSFYTYFEDKQDLLKWLVFAHADQHFRGYIEKLKENGGDIWSMLDGEFERSVRLMQEDGLIEIFENLIKSAHLSEAFRGGPDNDPKVQEQSRIFVNVVCGLIDQKRFPMSEEEVHDLMEMQMMILIMALKKYFRNRESVETVEAYYRRHLEILRFGLYKEPK